MHQHQPSCLQGPVTGCRDWWADSSDREIRFMDHPPDDQLREQRPIRMELVERVREAIAQGNYETPEKWEIALSRLLERLQEE
jgi:hypothetical protein